MVVLYYQFEDPKHVNMRSCAGGSVLPREMQEVAGRRFVTGGAFAGRKEDGRGARRASRWLLRGGETARRRGRALARAAERAGGSQWRNAAAQEEEREGAEGKRVQGTELIG